MKHHPSRHANHAIAYVRVSTDHQDLGPEAQKVAIQRWCQTNGIEVVAVFQEEISGGVPIDKRPQLLAAIDALAIHSAGVLIVAKRDRLARDSIAAGMIERLVERQGSRVMSADNCGNGEGPEAQLMRGIIDLFAQYERALIKARTKAALGVKKARQERIGKVPFGYQLSLDGVHLEPHIKEQEVIALMVSMRADGSTLREITERLNNEGIPARGKRWHLTSVARVLKREAA